MQVIDMTDAINTAKASVEVTITGHMEPWEDYIDWKAYRILGTHTVYKGVSYTIGKYGLISWQV